MFDPSLLHLGTLVSVLRHWAAVQPDEVAFLFLEDGEIEGDRWTYRELDTRARAIAAALCEGGSLQDHVLVACPAGLHFIAALMGCVYAGMVPVPTHVQAWSAGAAPRLAAIALDAKARAILTTSQILHSSRDLFAAVPHLMHVRALAVDTIPLGRAEDWREPDVGPGSIALLQYTSGSTSTPLGVEVSHGNILYNEQIIQHAFGHEGRPVIVGWLPMFHDMGLIGNVLQPLFIGSTCVLMAPEAFLARPIRWLSAISRYRGHSSGAPSFAYHLCVRRTTPEERASLDLSSWKVAFNGAEPVRADVLERFAKAFGPHGFRKEAFYPCYGLAEATLFVSGGRPGAPPVVRRFEAESLSQGRVVPVELNSSGGRTLVGCGRTWLGQEIVVVDPESSERCEEGRVGEIWLAGPSVARGYWNKPEESSRTFRASIAGSAGKDHLRTGDLGFLMEGELYVTGRLKDLIILRGRNHYPQDIEWAIERSHPALRPGCSAAFSVEVEQEERVVIVQEVKEKGGTPEQGAEILWAIRRAAVEECQVQPYAVVLIEPQTLPKTTSGKVRRRRCREEFVAGKLRVVSAWQEEAAAKQGSAAAARSAEQVEQWLCSTLTAQLHVDASRLSSRTPLSHQGVDSMGSIDLLHALEERYGVRLPLSAVLDQPTIASLSRAVADAQARGGGDRDAVAAELDDALSNGERALWFECRIAPNLAAYNAASAFLLPGRPDPAALQRALGKLVEHHPGLRTTFDEVDGLPRRRVHATMGLPIALIEAEGWDRGRLDARIAQIIRQPIDLRRGPLLRATIFTLDDESVVLLLVVHHLVADHWSQEICLNDLRALYASELDGASRPLSRPQSLPASYARRQRASLAGAEGERLWGYWRDRLSGARPFLDLPTDRPLPPVRGYQAGTRHFAIPSALVGRLHALCRERGVTLFTALLATFQLLLHRYSGQRDLVVGTPAACREAAEREVVGYFVNLLALRAELAASLPFTELLEQTRKSVVGALEHGDYPFDLLVERLSPPRDNARPPLVQAAFVLHQPRRRALEDEQAKGTRAASAEEPTWTAIPVDQPGAPFELMLTVVDGEGDLAAFFNYDAALFEPASIERAGEHYLSLLEGATLRPESAIATLLPAVAPPRPPAHAENVQARAQCLHDSFSEQAQRTPDRTALSCDGVHLTYAELDQRSNRVARYLKELGASVEAPVGLCVERGLDAVVGLLGILKSGSAYLPMSPRLPAERISLLLGDAGAKLVLTEEAWLPRIPKEAQSVCLDRDRDLIDQQPSEAIGSGAAPGNLAYMIFTSGSTGRPKGVGVEHRQVQALMAASLPSFNFGPDDVWTLFHSLSFDVSVWELWGALLHGGRLVIVPHGVSRSPVEFHGLLQREKVTVLNQVPSAFRLLVEAEELGQATGALNLRLIIFAGEPLDFQSVRAWARRHGLEQPTLVNMYGITETTVHSTVRRLHPEDIEEPARQRIGQPLPHLHMHVLNPDGTLAAMGVRGELYVGGTGVSRGYVGRPGWTAARFLPDPFSDVPGARLYRSGDLGRMLPDGDLEYLGRMDHQLQIRGHRVEPGEIESALRAHPAVRDAVVIGWNPEAHPGADPGDAASALRLLAYVEVAGDAPGVDALREFMVTRLPAYMVPSAFVFLAEMPRTSGGKPDRKGLPPPPHGRPDMEQRFVPPQTDIERTLAQIWCDVLELDQVGVEDDFFALGGDSIRSLQVVSRCRELGIELSVGQIFQAPRIRGLTRSISIGPAVAVTLPPFALVPDSIRARLADDVVDAYPASMLQSVLHHQSSSSQVYEVYVTSFLVRAPFDRAAMQLSLADLASHHAMLRTSFDLSRPGEPLQVVHATAEIPLTWEDLSSLSPEAERAHRESWMDRERRRPFDWTAAPLMRVHLQRCTEDTFRITMTEPFLDGWSVASLVTELLEHYHAHRKGTALRRDNTTASYAWFVQQEREASHQDRQFWSGRIRELPECPLPSLREPSPRQVESGSRRLSAKVDAQVAGRLIALSRARAIPIKQILLAAHLRVLSYLCGRTEVVTGVMVNARPDIAGAERIIGMFLNTLPLSAELSGQTWMSLAAAALEWEREVLPHRWVPFAELQRMRAERPLFDVAFNYTHFHVFRALKQLDGIEVLDWDALDQTYFALSAQFNFDAFTSTLRIALDYDPQRLEGPLVQRVLGWYVSALEGFSADPDQLVLSRRLMSEEEWDRLRGTWNDTAVSWRGPELIHTLFEDQARRTPEAVALVTEGGTVTFGALEQRANQLAHHLIAAGVRPETRVAICLPRSVEMVVALLGTLKASGAYVPLDPSYPKERIAFILEDAAVKVVVSDQPCASRLPPFNGAVIRLDDDRAGIERRPTTAPSPNAAACDLAYVLYTSGSTGTPKGVLGLHRGAVNRMRWMWERFPFTPGDIACLKTSLGFVDSVWETFGPLCAGVPTAVIPDEVSRDAVALAEALARFRVTHLVLVPSLLGVLLDVVPAPVLSSVRSWISSGEALPSSLARRFAALLPRATLVNLYGSSEVAADVTWHDASQLTAGSNVPCGRPIANTRIFILDDDFEAVPEGLTGEICVGGAGLARGYLGQPGWTAERFMPDPFSGEAGARLYRTGDRGRYLPDGTLEFRGRRDHQIKIRGQRIEIGEISTKLALHPSAAQAVCHAWSEESGDLRLVGYVVFREGHAATADELRAYLGQHLPGYMVPADFVVLEGLPLLPSGKVDRARLPPPERASFDFEQGFEPLGTPTEIAIASIWSELLGVEAIGVHDSFIQLGGHSLLATRLLARVREAFHVDLPVRTLLERQTVAGLAAAVDAAKQAGVAVTAVRRRSHQGGPLPLSVAQRSLWYQSQFAPESPAYNMPASVRLRGPLDVDALFGALEQITRRHAALRLSITAPDNEPRGELRDAPPRPVIEDVALPDEERRAAVQAFSQEETRKPFDLAQDPLIRVRLLRFDPTDHLLLVTLHHIAADEWSLGVLIQEINELYAALRGGRAPRLPELHLDYADFAAFQSEQIAGGALDSQISYWTGRLRGELPQVSVPADHPRPAVQRFEGASLSFSLSPEVSDGIRRLGRAHEATVFMVLLAAFEAQMHHYTNAVDLTIGTDFAQRDSTDLEGLVGLFVNQSVLRVDLSGEPAFPEILARVRDVTLSALANKDLPFARLVEVLRPTRDSSRSPLFQVKFVLQTAPLPAWELPGLEVEVIPVDTRTAKFDLLFNLWDAAPAISGVVEYDTALFEERTILRVIADFELLTSRIVNEPEASLTMIRGWVRAAQEAERERARRQRAQRGRQGLGAVRPRPIPLEEEEE